MGGEASVMSTKRDEIIRYTNEYLSVHEFKDYGPQGLQYLGKPVVHRIATAVSCDLETINKARAIEADMLIVHHGLFWNNEPHRLDKRLKGRLAALENGVMSLAAYHLCLDAHEDIGNNYLAAKALGIERPIRFGEIGWGGPIPPTVDIFSRIFTEFPDHVAQWFPYGAHDIKSACVITGGAAHYIHEASDQGYDLFVTGEAAENTQGLSRDLEINFVAAGHHETEKAGVRALGDLLAELFDVEHYFINVENPI